MKVILVNGSLHEKGTTGTALEVVSKRLNDNGIETEIFNIGSAPIKDCMACGACKKLEGRCVNDDLVNRFLEKAETADGFVFGTPVYYSHPSGRLLAFMDRVFYAGGKVLKYKPVYSIAAARRTGSVESVDVLNKHFSITQMPIVTSTYWGEIHGSKGEDIPFDEEGMETILNGADNLAWLLNCIDVAKKKGVNYPNTAKTKRTNFVR